MKNNEFRNKTSIDQLIKESEFNPNKKLPDSYQIDDCLEIIYNKTFEITL